MRKMIVLVAACLSTSAAFGQITGYMLIPGLSLGASPELRRISLPSGSTEAVGLVGPVVEALAFSPDGTLYGVDAFFSNTDRLYTLDLSTGAAAPVGFLGIDMLAARGLTFDASGNLWLAALIGGENRLYGVDPDTGAASLVGVLNLPVEGLAAVGDTVYGVEDQLLLIDTANAGISTVGGADFGVYRPQSLTVDGEGTLWTLATFNDPPPPFGGILTIDPATGLSTVELSFPGSREGLASLAIRPPDIFTDGFESGDLSAWSASSAP